MRIVFNLLCLLTLTFLVSCDKTRYFDENKPIDKTGWYYNHKLFFDVPIDNPSQAYNMLINVRVNNKYKYSNLFIVLNQTNPDRTDSSERFEIQLADESGKWLGKGLGDLFDYQQPIKQNIIFKEPGVYRFELAQNMRDDTLLHVISAGIRLEKIE